MVALCHTISAPFTQSGAEITTTSCKPLHKVAFQLIFGGYKHCTLRGVKTSQDICDSLSNHFICWEGMICEGQSVSNVAICTRLHPLQGPAPSRTVKCIYELTGLIFVLLQGQSLLMKIKPKK